MPLQPIRSLFVGCYGATRRQPAPPRHPRGESARGFPVIIRDCPAPDGAQRSRSPVIVGGEGPTVLDQALAWHPPAGTVLCPDSTARDVPASEGTASAWHVISL